MKNKFKKDIKIIDYILAALSYIAAIKNLINKDFGGLALYICMGTIFLIIAFVHKVEENKQK